MCRSQTPESWDDLSSVASAVERRRSKSQVMPYKRSHSVGSGDQLKNVNVPHISTVISRRELAACLLTPLCSVMARCLV